MSDTATAPRNSLSTWEGFEAELVAREQAIVSMLPKHISRERFINSAVAAVKQTPDLLSCTLRSLFAAVTKSAQDGILPDGREGVITVYNEKQKDGKYAKVAQWNPMTFGLRKRARDLDHLIVDAQVVHAADTFVWHQGDEPRIEHEPAKLGTPRGNMIGAYAIFKRESGEILHREVMDGGQIDKVRQQSKMPDGLMWVKFPEEAWRKTAVRRGFKTVPCSEPLQQIVERDNDMFAFEESQAAPVMPPPIPASSPTLISNTTAMAMPSVKEEADPLEIPVSLRRAAPASPVPSEAGSGVASSTGGTDPFPGTEDPEKFRTWCDKLLSSATDIDALSDIFNSKIEPYMATMFPPDREDLYGMYSRHERWLGAD